KMSSDPARPQAERDDIANTFLTAMSFKTNVFGEKGVEQIREKFNKDRIFQEGYGEITNDTYDPKNYEGRLDNVRFDALQAHAARVETRREASDRRAEKDVEAAQEDRKIEVGTLIAQRRPAEASQ